MHMLRVFGQLLHHISQHDPTMFKWLNNENKIEKSKKGHRLAKLEKIKTDCIGINLKKTTTRLFSKFISIYMKISLIILQAKKISEM